MRVTITQNIKEYNLKASQNIKFFRVIINRLGKRGLNGKSAYEVAVANGFAGTEPEWFLSLTGADGKSAYEVAVANGFAGTEPEWFLSLIGADSIIPGPKGDKGDTGNDSVIPGPKGDKGDVGGDSIIPGPKGDKGDTGNDSIIPGPKGDKGDAGNDSIIPGPKGDIGDAGNDSIIPGPKGDKGDAGNDSIIPGPKGDKGDTGNDSIIPGPKGDKGDVGGDSIIPGPKGDIGDKGDVGTVDITLLTNEIDRAIEAESTKVDKIEGFSLTKNDFTDILKEKLDSITAIFTTTLKDNYDGAVAWVENNKNNLIAHLSLTNNPHNVTKEQVGLGNVENTSDLLKPTSTATQLVLDTKLDKTSYNEHFKSQYLTEAALKLANPTGVAGDYAQVNELGSKTVVNYNWDTEANTWIINTVTGSGATTTDTLPEGTKNLYWTVARFLANLTAANIKAALGITTLSGANTGDQTAASLGINLKADKTELGIVAIDEGKGIGYVIANRNPLNYGPVGRGSVDLSYSDSASNTRGGSGDYSIASGYGTTASGFSATASGYGTTASGFSATASGYGSTASGFSATASGYGSTASGNSATASGYRSTASGDYSTASGYGSTASAIYATASGNGSIAKSFLEIVFGSFNTVYTPISTYSINPLDRIFGLGNGQGNLNRSDALIILKNGLTTLPSVTNALITAEPTGKAVVTKEYLEAKYLKNNSSIQLIDNSAIPSATTEGMIRYRNDIHGSYVDVVMQTAPSVFEWVNVVENTDIPVVVIVPESPNAYISSGNEVSTNSLIDETISGMSFTPKFPGTYRVDFNANYSVIAGNVCIIATLDLQNLYLDLMNRPATGIHGLTFGSGETVTSGIYTVSGAMSVAGTLTLDGGGDPNALFVFRVTGAINTAIATSIVLTNGANAANVFFMAIGAVGIGADNVISGNFIAYGAAAALGANCIFNGRLFSTSGALAFSSGKQTKPIAKSVVDMGILNSFLCFTNQGNVANTALAVITGDLGTGFGNVTTFTNSVFIGDAYDNNQQLGGTSVFSVYKENELVPFSDRTREYSNYLQDVQLMSTVTVLENEAIHIKWRTDVGRVLLKNRILIITKI